MCELSDIISNGRESREYEKKGKKRLKEDPYYIEKQVLA